MRVAALSKLLTTPRKATHQDRLKIPDTATFDEVLAQLNSFYKVSDGESLVFGNRNDEEVTTFDGVDFRTFLKDKGKQNFMKVLY